MAADNIFVVKSPDMKSLTEEKLDHYKKIFTCGVCTDLICLPTTLNCQHTYCRQCIEDHIEKSSRGDKCPQCGKRFILPSETNHSMEEIIADIFEVEYKARLDDVMEKTTEDSIRNKIEDRIRSEITDIMIQNTKSDGVTKIIMEAAKSLADALRDEERLILLTKRMIGLVFIIYGITIIGESAGLIGPILMFFLNIFVSLVLIFAYTGSIFILNSFKQSPRSNVNISVSNNLDQFPILQQILRNFQQDSSN